MAAVRAWKVGTLPSIYISCWPLAKTGGWLQLAAWRRLLSQTINGWVFVLPSSRVVRKLSLPEALLVLAIRKIYGRR